MEIEEKYMRRCIELAQNGCCYAAPNPMVGAVIVSNGRIIGEGYHARCGEAHAEVNAIRSVREPHLLRSATLYVSLEPCSHYGKTPPCADLIIEKQIPRVVVGCLDPFIKVAGRGIEKLRAAGVEVATGVLEEECKALINRFLTFHQQQRPYITLKWAQSSDGFIDRLRTGGEPLHLSSPLTLMRVHRLRAEHSAILVGRGTALLDNPSLNVRHWSGPQPVRIVIDRQGKLQQQHLHLFDGSQRTLLLTETPGTLPVEYRILDFSSPLPPQIATLLHQEGLQSLLVEGGSYTLQSFIDAGHWDEAFVEEAPLVIGQGVTAPTLKELKSVEVEQHFGHLFRHYRK
ncbi:MAG: bifunctional diaminohydroxyphosphoribosylaminopyrimidine deaminase/5-amino-6-(5-phosphoribosylamino)uracil reductase RibD [Bacteroides sp.]